MAREFAKEFYNSPEWKRVRDYIFLRDGMLCVRCGNPGEIVHHKIHLNPHNITDPYIALGEDNLELLCRQCHGEEHSSDIDNERGYTFNDDGEMVIPPHKKA